MVTIVNNPEIRKTIFGSLKIRYDCPHCHASLQSEPKEVGIADKCPYCEGEFIISRDALEEFERSIKKPVVSEGQPSSPDNVKKSSALEKLVFGIICLAYVALFIPVTKPLMRWSNPNTDRDALSAEANKLISDIDRETQEKIARLVYPNQRQACIECRTGRIVKYEEYYTNGRRISLGFCSSCTPPSSIGSGAKQPDAPQYIAYIKKKKAIEESQEDKKNDVAYKDLDLTVPPIIWGAILIIWWIPAIVFGVMVFCLIAIIDSKPKAKPVS